MKQRSEKGDQNKPQPLARIEKQLPAVRISKDPTLFKKVVRSLSQIDLINEIMKQDNQITSLFKRSREDHSLIIDEICLLILDLQKFFNTKIKLDEDQILDLSEMIVAEYQYLSIFDIAFCFKEGKFGRYGKVYDRLDGGILLGWIKEWDNKRMSLIIQRREEEHSRNK